MIVAKLYEDIKLVMSSSILKGIFVLSFFTKYALILIKYQYFEINIDRFD